MQWIRVKWQPVKCVVKSGAGQPLARCSIADHSSQQFAQRGSETLCRRKTSRDASVETLPPHSQQGMLRRGFANDAEIANPKGIVAEQIVHQVGTFIMFDFQVGVRNDLQLQHQRLNMAWILPKQLHTLASVQGTEALILDSEEQSQAYAQSLFLRSNVSRVRTWSAKWKRDSWMRHLSGRMLKPSLGKNFLDEWTSSLEVTPANHSHRQENDLEQTIPDTFGHSLQTEFGFSNLNSASLKTSKDTLPLDSEKSLANWNQWVTRCRGEYSLRVKSAHRINANECSSLQWPTAQVTDSQGACLTEKRLNRPKGTQLREAVHGHLDQINLNTHLNPPESWATPRSRDSADLTMGKKRVATGKAEDTLSGQVKSWATPQQRDFKDPESLAKWTARAEEQKAKGVNLHLPLPSQVMHNEEREATWPTPEAYVVRGPIPTEFVDGKFVSLHGEVKYGAKIADAVRVMEEQGNWATPQASDHVEGARTEVGSNQKCLGRDLNALKTNGKLNPRWVETLMGLPVGWTMPSCQSPVTIAPIAELVVSVGGNWPTASTMDAITPTRNLLSMESKGHWGKKPRSKPNEIGFTAPNTGKLSEMVNYIQTSTSPVIIVPTNCDCLEMELFQQPQP